MTHTHFSESATYQVRVHPCTVCGESQDIICESFSRALSVASRYNLLHDVTIFLEVVPDEDFLDPFLAPVAVLDRGFLASVQEYVNNGYKPKGG